MGRTGLGLDWGWTRVRMWLGLGLARVWELKGPHKPSIRARQMGVIGFPIFLV